MGLGEVKNKLYKLDKTDLIKHIILPIFHP